MIEGTRAEGATCLRKTSPTSGRSMTGLRAPERITHGMVVVLSFMYSVPQGIRAEFAVILAVLTLGLAYFSGQLRSLRLPLDAVVLSLFVVGSISWVTAPNRSLALYAQTAVGVSTALLIFSQARPGRPIAVVVAKSLSLALMVHLASVILIPAYAVAQAPLPGWRGLTGHKNVLSMFAVAQLGIVAGLWRQIDRRHFIAMWMLGAVVVIGTQSSTGLAAAACATVAGIYFGSDISQQHVRRASLVMRVGYLGLVAFARSSSEVLNEASSTFGKAPGLSGRSDLWVALRPYLAQRPIGGYGFGGVWQGGSHWQFASAGPADPVKLGLMRSLRWGVATAHNQWFELLLQLGMVGLFLAGLATWRCGSSLATLSPGRYRGAWFGLYVALLMLSLTESLMLNPLMLTLTTLLLLVPLNSSAGSLDRSSMNGLEQRRLGPAIPQTYADRNGAAT